MNGNIDWPSFVVGACMVSAVFLLAALLYVRATKAFKFAAAMCGLSMMGLAVCALAGVDPTAGLLQRLLYGIPTFIVSSIITYLGFALKEKDMDWKKE